MERPRKTPGGARPDEELVRAFQAGSEEAFQALFERYGDRAYFFALGLTRSEPLAEEAVQEAFLSFLRGLDRFRPGGAGSFRAWLFRAVRSRALDALAREGRLAPLSGEDPPLFEEGRAGPGALEAKEKARILGGALASLPRAQREAVVLKVFEGMTFREIGEVTGVSPNTASSRYRYGIEKLRSLLERRVRHG